MMPIQPAAEQGRSICFAAHPNQNLAFDHVGPGELGLVADAREEGARLGERGACGI
jgi:hypothetical protein